VLKIAGLVGGVPLPLPSLSATLDGTMSDYEGMLLEVMNDSSLKGVSDAMGELGVYEDIEKFVKVEGVGWLSDNKAANMKRLTGQAYRLFSEVALDHKNRLLWEPYMKWDVVGDKFVWMAK